MGARHKIDEQRMQHMIGETAHDAPPAADDRPESPEAPAAAETETGSPALPREIGGRDGPDPTRYGDWEKNGRCIDF
jgi:hypothetical protein